MKENIYKQLTVAIESALLIGERFVCLELSGEAVNDTIRETFFREFGCAEHRTLVGELLPYYFTPNDSESACITCRGLGIYKKAQPHLVVENWNKSINQGALTNTFFNIKHPYKYMLLYSLAQNYHFSLDTAFSALPKEAQNVIFMEPKTVRSC